MSESSSPEPTVPAPSTPGLLTGPVVEQAATLPISPALVWSLLTTPEGIATWYTIGGGAEIDAEVGGDMLLWWEEGATFRGRVTVSRPPGRFDYQIPQTPGSELEPEHATLVQFKIDAVAGDPQRAVVTVRESGFGNVEHPQDAFTASSVAWIGAFGLLQQVAEQMATMTSEG